MRETDDFEPVHHGHIELARVGIFDGLDTAADQHLKSGPSTGPRGARKGRILEALAADMINRRGLAARVDDVRFLKLPAVTHGL